MFCLGCILDLMLMLIFNFLETSCTFPILSPWAVTVRHPRWPVVTPNWTRERLALKNIQRGLQACQNRMFSNQRGPEWLDKSPILAFPDPAVPILRIRGRENTEGNSQMIIFKEAIWSERQTAYPGWQIQSWWLMWRCVWVCGNCGKCWSTSVEP